MLAGAGSGAIAMTQSDAVNDALDRGVVVIRGTRAQTETDVGGSLQVGSAELTTRGGGSVASA